MPELGCAQMSRFYDADICVGRQNAEEYRYFSRAAAISLPCIVILKGPSLSFLRDVTGSYRLSALMKVDDSTRGWWYMIYTPFRDGVDAEHSLHCRRWFARVPRISITQPLLFLSWPLYITADMAWWHWLAMRWRHACAHMPWIIGSHIDDDFISLKKLTKWQMSTCASFPLYICMSKLLME